MKTKIAVLPALLLIGTARVEASKPKAKKPSPTLTLPLKVPGTGVASEQAGQGVPGSRA